MRGPALRPPDPPDKRERRPICGGSDGGSRNSFGQKRYAPYHKPACVLALRLRYVLSDDERRFVCLEVAP